MTALNIGANSFREDGWLNLDHPSTRYSNEQAKIDVPHDLMSGESIALNDNTLKAAYTSHTIEHISDEYVEQTFKEVYRMLEPGGVFRVTCPDSDRLYKAYVNGDKEYLTSWVFPHPDGRQQFFRSFGLGEQLVFIVASNMSPYSKRNPDLARITEGIEVFQEPEIENILKTKSKEDALTFFTDACQERALHLQKQIPGNHVSWWNFEKIKNIMEKVGFKDAHKKKYNESDYEIFKNFDEKNKDSVAQKHYSVFVEAKK